MSYELTDEELAAYEAELAEIDEACEPRRGDDDEWEGDE